MIAAPTSAPKRPGANTAAPRSPRRGRPRRDGPRRGCRRCALTARRRRASAARHRRLELVPDPEEADPDAGVRPESESGHQASPRGRRPRTRPPRRGGDGERRRPPKRRAGGERQSGAPRPASSRSARSDGSSGAASSSSSGDVGERDASRGTARPRPAAAERDGRGDQRKPDEERLRRPPGRAAPPVTSRRARGRSAPAMSRSALGADRLAVHLVGAPATPSRSRIVGSQVRRGDEAVRPGAVGGQQPVESLAGDPDREQSGTAAAAARSRSAGPRPPAGRRAPSSAIVTSSTVTPGHPPGTTSRSARRALSFDGDQRPGRSPLSAAGPSPSPLQRRREQPGLDVGRRVVGPLGDHLPVGGRDAGHREPGRQHRRRRGTRRGGCPG